MGPGTVFVDPGKYQYHNCAQLLEQRKYWADRELELKLLIDEAEQGSGGAFASVIAYQSEHMAAREELKVIEQAATAKNCDRRSSTVDRQGEADFTQAKTSGLFAGVRARQLAELAEG